MTSFLIPIAQAAAVAVFGAITKMGKKAASTLYDGIKAECAHLEADPRAGDEKARVVIDKFKDQIPDKLEPVSEELLKLLIKLALFWLRLSDPAIQALLK